MSDPNNPPETEQEQPDQPDQPQEVNSTNTEPRVEDQSAKSQSVTTDQAVKPEEAGGKSYDDVAKEVLAGQWGRGHRREERLERAGYNRSAVQSAMNRLLGTEEYGHVKNEGLQNTQDERARQ